MTDEPEHEEVRLTETENRSSDELADQERSLQASNEHVEGEAAGLEHKYSAGTHARSGTYRQEGQQTGCSFVRAAQSREQSNTHPQSGTPKGVSAGDSSSTGDVTDYTTDTNLMQLELTDEEKKQKIVRSYGFDPETDNLSSALNHKYSERKITSPIESTWPKTIATLTKELQRKKISAEHETTLCDVADNAAD